jgi:hypothetical protein
MNVLLPWLFLAFIVVAAAGVFLLALKRGRASRKINYEAVHRPLFQEETAQEPGIHIPASTITPKQADQDPQLPHRYGVDRLTLMARDPHWLYAYWEITATKQEEFNTNYGPAAWSSTHPVLRVYDVTGVDFNGTNAKGFVDIHVGEHVDNWYIQVGEPDRSFCVDLGRMFQDGHFVTLLRSNIVTTPRASLSDRLDEEWMWIEGLYHSIGRFQYGASSPMIIEELARRAGKLPLEVTSPGIWNPQQK